MELDKWLLLRGIILVVSCLSSALLVSSSANTKSSTCCSDGLGLNYTLPMFNECKKKQHPNGSMVQTIPKLVPYSSVEASCPRRKSKLGIPPGHRVCSFPDCDKDTCVNGWCEETMQNFTCHCSPGYRGERCNIETSDSSTTSMTDPTTFMTGSTTSMTDPSTSIPGSTTSMSDPTTSMPGSTTSMPDPTTSVPASTTSMRGSTTSEPGSTTSMPDSTTTNPPTTTVSPTTMALPTTTDQTTSNPPTTAQPTAKIFVTSEGDDNKIFLADLEDELTFTDISATQHPRYLAYDSVDKKIYRTDRGDKRVHRSDVDGGNRDTVTSQKSYAPSGIAIAETSRILYIASYYYEFKITSVSIEEGSPIPGTESDFETGLTWPRSLEVDEQQGYLYWTMGYRVYRKALNGTRNKEVVYQQQEQTFHKLTGLSIDLSRSPRRIFFCDFNEERSFYKDLHNGASVNDAVELTSYFTGDSDDAGTKLTDITYFDGVLYGVKSYNPGGFAVLTNYEFSNRSYNIKGTSDINKPFQLLFVAP